MEKICFLFPGQGSQKQGMALPFLKIAKNYEEIFNIANDVLKDDFLKICTQASQEELNQTKNAQPAIVITSLLAFFALKEKAIRPDSLAGHSLGQYSALAAAGVLSLKDTFKILKIRIKSIEEMKTKEKGTMAAIIGTPVDKIEETCKKVEGYVVCANYNGPNQTVISGETDSVLAVCSNLKDIARKCLVLNVSHAFHSKLMQQAAKTFEKEIETIKFNEPQFEIYSNITAKPIKKTDDIKSLLVSHLISPVNFTETLFNLEKNETSIFLELGCGTTLSGIVRKTLKNKTILNVQDEESFKKTIDFFENLKFSKNNV